jgi:hypothetical protein
LGLRAAAAAGLATAGIPTATSKTSVRQTRRTPVDA